MMDELIALLLTAAAVAAVAWIWPRLMRRPQRNLRMVRPHSNSRSAAVGPAVAPAAVSTHEAARLRRELAARMNSLRQTRKPGSASARPAVNHDDDGPVIGFAETMIQEDSKA